MDLKIKNIRHFIFFRRSKYRQHELDDAVASAKGGGEGVEIYAGIKISGIADEYGVTLRNGSDNYRIIIRQYFNQYSIGADAIIGAGRQYGKSYYALKIVNGSIRAIGAGSQRRRRPGISLKTRRGGKRQLPALAQGSVCAEVNNNGGIKGDRSSPF